MIGLWIHPSPEYVCGNVGEMFKDHEMKKKLILMLQVNRDSSTVGTLYEFDCKPIVKIDGGPPTNWQAIAYEQQVCKV